MRRGSFRGGGTVGMRTRLARFGTVLLVTLAVTGCGPDVKKENDQLKAQVETLQKENLALKGEATSLKADAEAMRRRFEAMNKEKQTLESQLKDAEAKIAIKPGTKPPLKPKKTS
jgi:predicted nuclease with TOPRIM domain